MGIGLRLKEILRNRKITIKELAEKSSISLNTLYSITKRDSQNIDPIILKRITETLGISTDEFLGIAPLPEQESKMHYNGHEQITVFTSEDQEFIAFDEYLDSMGYRTFLDLGTFDTINPNHNWTMHDFRSGKKYFIPIEKLNQLMYTINSYAKFQISTLIPELSEIPEETEKVPDATNIQD